MQKKALFIATGLVMGTPLQAAEMSFYGGAAIQKTTLSAHFDIRPSNPFRGDSDEDTDIGPRLFGGARWMSGQGIFYGVELAIARGNTKAVDAFSKVDNSDTGQRGQLEEGRSTGLSVIGGLEITDNTYVTGRIGRVRTEFDFKTLEGDTVFSSGDETFTGTQFALGLEHHYANGIGVRVEFLKTEYPDDIDTVANGTGDLARINHITRDALSIGVFTTF